MAYCGRLPPDWCQPLAGAGAGFAACRRMAGTERSAGGQESWRKRVGRETGYYFFHMSCAQSGSQAGGDMREASSADDLHSPSIFSTSHA